MSDNVDPLAGRTFGEEVPLPASNTSGEEVSIPGYRPSGFQDGLENARQYGYAWSAIHDHLAQSTLAAMDYGYSENEIDRHLGFNDPSDFEGRTRDSWAKQFASDPDLLTELSAPGPKLDLTMNPSLRQDYADALLKGDVKGPRDFAERYAAAALNAAHELHGLDASDNEVLTNRRAMAAEQARRLALMLPNREDLADGAVALSGGDPNQAARARQNLLDNWVATGTGIIDAATHAQTDPSFLDRLMGGVGKAFHDLGPLGDLISDLGFGIAAGFAFPDEEFRARYGADKIAEALRQGPPPNLAEHVTAAITHAVLAPGREYARALLESGPEVVQRVLEGKGFTVEEALDLAFLALTPAAGKYPGGNLPPNPEILPPLPRTALPPPEPGLPGAPGGPIIEHEPIGPLIKLPPMPPLEVIDPLAPLGTPRQLISPKEALGPVPAEERTINAAAQELSDIPIAEREAKLQKLAALEVENQAPEGGGTFFQRILQQQIDRGEITPQAAARIEEPTPQHLTELAEGYDAAKSLFQHFYGILGEVLKDESGALRWRTPDQQAFWDTFARSRDIAHRILIPNIMRGVKNDVLLSRMMDSYRGDIAPHVNEFARASRAGDGMAMIDSEIGKFLGYVENRNWGGVLRNSKLQPLADALAAIAQHGEKMMRDAKAEGLIDDVNIIDNWYKHLWKDPKGPNWENLMAHYGMGKQGSGSFLGERSWPTMYDGMKLGVSPMFDNPIDQALFGEHQRSYYLNALRSIKQAKAEGQVYYAYRPDKPGDIALDGVRNEVSAGGILRLYGEPGFARAYNNMLSQGANAYPLAASTYQRLLWAGNMSTAIKLLWPGFHMRVMGIGTLASGFAQGMDEVGRGEFLKALGSFGKVAVAPVQIVDNLWVGFRSIYRYNRDMKDPVLDLITEAGLRVTPRQSIYHVGAESLTETMKRGGFIPTQGKWDVVGGVQEIVRTIGRDIQATGGDPRVEGSLYRMFRLPDRAIIQLPLTEVGRVMQTATSPFFDFVIPALKAGAAYNRLSSWLDKNRFATDEQKWFQARQVVRDVENRMGELNQDVLFGPKLAKQIANLGMVSTGWKYGSWRGFLSAVGYDFERGGRLGKLQWNQLMTNSLIGTMAVYSMFNALEQVAHGQPPFYKTDTAIYDLMNARTGGTSRWGGPARLMDPSELKEVYDAAKVVLTAIYSPKDGPTAAAEYVMNALNPFWHAVYGTITGRDGISPQARSVYDRPGGYPAFLEETFGPIVYQQLKEIRPGSGLNPIEVFMGTREAAKWVTNWTEYIQAVNKGHERTMKDELRREQYKQGITPPKKERGGRRNENKPTWGKGWYQ